MFLVVNHADDSAQWSDEPSNSARRGACESSCQIAIAVLGVPGKGVVSPVMPMSAYARKLSGVLGSAASAAVKLNSDDQPAAA